MALEAGAGTGEREWGGGAWRQLGGDKMIQLGREERLREVVEVDGEEGIDLRSSSKALHGEEGK